MYRLSRYLEIDHPSKISQVPLLNIILPKSSMLDVYLCYNVVEINVKWVLKKNRNQENKGDPRSTSFFSVGSHIPHRKKEETPKTHGGSEVDVFFLCGLLYPTQKKWCQSMIIPNFIRCRIEWRDRIQISRQREHQRNLTLLQVALLAILLSNETVCCWGEAVLLTQWGEMWVKGD